MYKLEISNTAARALRGIYYSDRKIYSRLIAVIESLSQNIHQGKQLKGQFRGDFSVRVGDYRIIYTVQKERLIVLVIDVGHSKSIYR